VVRDEVDRVLALFSVDDWFFDKAISSRNKGSSGSKITTIFHRRIPLYLIGAMQHTHSPHRDLRNRQSYENSHKVDYDLWRSYR
jgi:hypothetical protein